MAGLSAACWREYLEACTRAGAQAEPMNVCGRLTRVAGLIMEAVGLRLPIGSVCNVHLGNGEVAEAEIVGFNGERLFLMPLNAMHGVTPGARVTPFSRPAPPPTLQNRRCAEVPDPLQVRDYPVGEALLGRVVDATGTPLDAKGPIGSVRRTPLTSNPINPLERAQITEPLDVGVRAINALLTIGRGQRMGLFAGSGVGKSVLLGMMAKYTAADVTVVGLIGERGREVKEFIEQILGPQGRSRSVVVAAPADTTPLMRVQGAAYATAIAEHFRDQGKNVLLLMDSLTRFAMAQREIALAVGEPPATKGYPPSVFARLPMLVERAGNGKPGRGSITAFYTVLVEGDDFNDPIADSARAILDGHITLSRLLADQGHFPAIDLEGSISRAMPNLATQPQQDRVRRFRSLYTRYQRNRDLITVGAYVPGNDALLDAAVAAYPGMEAYLQQNMEQRVTHAQSLKELEALVASIAGTPKGAVAKAA